MIRQAGPEDAENIETFLIPHAASSMFLRGNLAAHGTRDLIHPHGTTFWLYEDEECITAIAGCTNGGYLMCQAPDADAAFWYAVTDAVAGREIQGMTGVPSQISALAEVLGCAPADFALREIEPLYALDLQDWQSDLPEGLALRSPQASDQNLLEMWFAGYHADTGMAPPKGSNVRDIARGYIGNPDARLLTKAGQPVGMTTFNARAAEIVQVGGVYVAPDQRGQGLGGAVVALHLMEARVVGTKQAILFAANDFAARAYERIGFARIGSYEVALLREPKLIRDVSIENVMPQLSTGAR